MATLALVKREHLTDGRKDWTPRIASEINSTDGSGSNHQDTHQWIPCVLSEVMPGDIYKLVINGVPQEQECKALTRPVPVLENGVVVKWSIEHEVLTPVSAN